ncbi:macrophage mannose receptor 1-like [Paroedura picta]|uniref:macrophage mannose receptor 1-like n=1 Tax=Paroedura picta TaxID=143630 RepID=UPI004056EF09
MSFFLLLNCLLLIQQSFQVSEDDTFLINYEKYNLCIQAGDTSAISLVKCNQGNKFQKFKWTSSQQILNMGLKSCLGASADLRQLEFSSCNQTSDLQKWECLNGTFPAIKDHNHFLAYEAGRVQLHNGPDVEATWKIDGTNDRLCTKGFEAQFTIGGNSNGAPCVFPFRYRLEWHAECTTGSGQLLWCGTTADVDKDFLKGYCPTKDDNEYFWIKNHRTGNQYQINKASTLTWLQARKSCQQQNAELLSFTELHEEMYLAGLTTDMNTDLWIGLNSLDMDSGWQWVGDHPFRYLNWAPGSPSPEPEKICATMQTQSGKWENKACGEKLGYICKKLNSSLNVPVISPDDMKPVRCSDDWVPYLGHCYHLHRDLKTWNDAQSACRNQGGELASIHNIEEHSFAISQLGYSPTDMLWIGLNAQKTVRYFEWSDGTPVTYTKWQREEPAYQYDSLDNCVIMTGENGYWVDSVCQEEHGYICKRKPSETLPESEEENPGCQKGWKRHGFYCYSAGQTLGTFSEAKDLCEGNQGSLVFIDDRYEQAYLTSLVGLRQEKYFWIGISGIKEEGVYNWTNGRLVTFSHWNTGMPGQNHGCVAMRTGTAAGLWDVISCEEKAAFICKQWAEGVTTTLAPTEPPLPPCPEGWSGAETSSSCYKAFTEKTHIQRTWFEARDFCREIGGDLASIHSYEEQKRINTLKSGNIWIGLSDLDSDEAFTWSDGSPTDYEHWNFWFSYDNNQEELCVTNWPWFWDAENCNNLHYWTCQVTKGVTLKPEPDDFPDKDYKIIEDGWVKYGDNEYYFEDTALPMGEARQFCRKHHGDLAAITSENERMFLWKYNHFLAFKADVYIGLAVGIDGKFGWLDGTPVTYEAWAPNEPNNVNEEEECVVMYKGTGLWNDIYCSAEKRFICERHNSSVRSTIAPTSPAPQGGCAEGWLLFQNKCFKIFGIHEEERKNWSDSRNACKSLGGNLAAIPNKEVQAFLTTQLKNAPVESWIGLHDIIGTFIWTDGTSVRYTNWVKGAPSHSFYHRYHPLFYGRTSNDNCVSMIKKPDKWAGNWRNRPCSIKYGYICQKKPDPLSPHLEPTIPASGFISYGNSSYYFIQNATWEEAREMCHSKHSELVSILDPYSQSFLWLMVVKYKAPLWIGLNSYVTNENYRWLSDRRLVYTNWAPGEPKEELACVYLDLDGQWKTRTCNEMLSAVCERYNGIRPTDHPQVAGRCPESQDKMQKTWIPFRDQCYIITFDRQPSPTASLKCTQLGGSLASIEDTAELKFLKEHIQLFNDAYFWIGFFKNVDGKWVWADGTAVDFVNWDIGEPGNYTKQYRYYYDTDLSCAAMNTKGKWVATACHLYTQGYICKTRKIFDAQATETSPTNQEGKKGDTWSAHAMIAMAVILVLIIITAAGFAGYIFYKRRPRQPVIANGFVNTQYSDNTVVLQTNNP